MTDELFACDFSRDELAVLADLLELPSLPGLDPETPAPEEAKAAAARGLLARGVVVADPNAGTVEITQPYATMLSLVLHAGEAESLELEFGSLVIYRGPSSDVVVTQADGPLVRWAVCGSRDGRPVRPSVVARREGERLSAGATTPGDFTSGQEP